MEAEKDDPRLKVTVLQLIGSNLAPIGRGVGLGQGREPFDRNRRGTTCSGILPSRVSEGIDRYREGAA